MDCLLKSDDLIYYSKTIQILDILYSMKKEYNLMILDLTLYFHKNDFTLSNFCSPIEVNEAENMVFFMKNTSEEYKITLGKPFFNINCKISNCRSEILMKSRENDDCVYNNCFHSLAIILYVKNNMSYLIDKSIKSLQVRVC